MNRDPREIANILGRCVCEVISKIQLEKDVKKLLEKCNCPECVTERANITKEVQ